jgi:hypothetical protein
MLGTRIGTPIRLGKRWNRRRARECRRRAPIARTRSGRSASRGAEAGDREAAREARSLGIAERLELPDENLGELPLKRPVPGLGSVSAAPRASAATVSSAPSSPRGDDHHLRAGGGANDPRDRFEAAGPRHFEVENDDVDPGLRGARRLRPRPFPRRLRFRRRNPASTMRDRTARATIESSTIISRMRRRVGSGALAGGPAIWRAPAPRRPNSGDADELQFDVKRLAVEGLHHIFVGTGL